MPSLIDQVKRERDGLSFRDRKIFPFFLCFYNELKYKAVCSLDIQMKLITSKWSGEKLEVQNYMFEFFVVSKVHLNKDYQIYCYLAFGFLFPIYLLIIKTQICFDCFGAPQSNNENANHSISSTMSGRKGGKNDSQHVWNF